jgi:hypothetical protein
MKEGYKVVRRKMNMYTSSCETAIERYFSCFASEHGRIEYFINIPVSKNPYCGPLSLFDNIKDAKLFYLNHLLSHDLSVFSCAYEKSTDEGLWILNLEFAPKSTLPNRTCFAEEITLLEKIDIDKI